MNIDNIIDNDPVLKFLIKDAIIEPGNMLQKNIRKAAFKIAVSKIDIDEKVELLYNRMFDKYYSDNDLFNWQSVTYFGGGNANLYKSKIKELLLLNKRVKTGYRTSSMIRGHKTLYIFYK